MSDNLYLFANNNGVQAENNGSYRLYDMKIEGDSEGVESGVNYVDYLIGDGASYIDTGIVGNNKYKYEIVFEDYTINYYENYFGIYSNDHHSLTVQRRTNVDAFDIKYNKLYQWISGYSKGERVKLYINTNKVYKNDELVLIMDEPTETISHPGKMFLFDRNPHDVCSNMRCYSFKTWNENNNLIQDLRPCLDTEGIPCMHDEVSKRYFYNQGTGTFGYKKTIRVFQPVLDSNNIPCLLDKINNKFYYNKGTGSFTYGGIQTPKDGYTEVEYIESNGTQYIDTGVVPNSNTDIDMTCRAVSNGGYILNDLQLDTTYKYNGTDTTAQPNLTASTGATLTMGSQNIAYLTEAEIAQAVLNGWTIQ